MPEISYWLDLFSHKTWSEFLQAGGSVSGFRESRWKTAQRINRGDYFLCYLTGVSRWIGLLEVTGRAYRDQSPIWEDDPFPVRFPVKVLIALRPETAVPIIQMRDRLSIFRDLANPHAWTGRLRGSPAKWTKLDGLAVVAALEQARTDPVERPLDHLKLKRRSPFFRSSDDSFVSIPDDEVDARRPGPVAEETRPSAVEEISAHLEIQWLLAKLGSDMGLKIWVARTIATARAKDIRSPRCQIW